MFHSRAEKLLEAAAAPAMARIRQDRAARASARVKPLLTYLEDHLFDPKLTVDTLKRECGVRDNSISSVFAQDLGDPPQAYYKDRRMETAARLLRDTDLKIWQIAEMMCFANPGSFSTSFGEWSGRPPEKHRKHSRESAAAVPLDEDLVNVKVLRRALSGEAEPDQLRRMIGHLQAFERTAGTTEPPPSGPPRLTIDGTKIHRGLALVFWEEIRHRPADEQTEMVRQPNSLHSPAFFHVLRQMSREEGRKDRQAGIRIAELALASLESIAPFVTEEQLANLQAQGVAGHAQARRLALDYSGAERTFKEAEAALPDQPDPRVVAEIQHYKAMFRLFQGKFDEAYELANRSLELCRPLGDSEPTAAALIARALAQGCRRAPEAAIPDLLEALGILDPAKQPYLIFCVYHNLLTAYALSGQHEEAQKRLSDARSHCKGLGDKVLLFQLRWVEGYAWWMRGDLTETEACFQAAQQGFQALGEVAHCAAVSLDLAELCLQQNQTPEALAWSLAAIPVFEEFKVHREAVAALKILSDAARGQSITRKVIWEIRSHLKKVLQNPLFAFVSRGL